jgi:peroxiredoxin
MADGDERVAVIWRLQILEMKRIVFMLVAVLCVPALFAQSSNFTLTGDISNLKAPIEWVYLSYIINNQLVKDSFLVKQESYSFTGKIDEPVLAELRISYKASRVNNMKVPFNSKRDYTIVFLEPGKITVTSVDSFANVVVAGSKADIEYRLLQELAKPYDDQLAVLYKQSAIARKNRDDDELRKLEKQIDSTNKLANEKVYGVYVKQSPGSPLALYAFRNWAGYQIDALKVEPVFKTLPLAVRNSTSGKQMQQRINIAGKTSVGQMAIDFTQKDTADNPVKLSSFRGKYLLLDFWASWCGPCRVENPVIVRIFNLYHYKGFQILSVSLDKPGTKAKWLKAIQDDDLRWFHVSDLQYWDNAVVKEYGIEAIPQNLLIDPTGKIIAKNLKGDDLEKKLAAIYSGTTKETTK